MIRSSERRQTIIDNAWIPATELFIARMAQAGVDVPLYAAEAQEHLHGLGTPRCKHCRLGASLLQSSEDRFGTQEQKEYLEFERFLGQEIAKGV